MKQYSLEIFEPGSADHSLVRFESDSSFGCISQGDLLQPLGSGVEDQRRVLKVKSVEHLIWETEGTPRHKTLVFTTAVANTRENRLSAMSLSRTDRWIISNQLRILEFLVGGDEAESMAYAREAIECGYEMEYDWGIEHIYKDTMSEPDCKEVLDILEMFDRLESSYEELDDKEGVQEYDGELTFHGWDGNNEGRQLGYARHFCKDRHRFERLGERAYMNSHMPTLDRYRIMLRKFLLIWNEKVHKTSQYSFSKEEIIEVLSAWRLEKDRLDEEYQKYKELRGEP